MFHSIYGSSNLYELKAFFIFIHLKKLSYLRLFGILLGSDKRC